MLWIAAQIRTPWRRKLFTDNGPIAKPALARSQVQRMVRLVDGAANHHVKRMTCLERTLTLQHLLARRGCHTTLHFGVQKSDAEIEAHAWLEGVPGLNDPLSANFIPLKKCGERDPS